jgi:hypothetical protein
MPKTIAYLRVSTVDQDLDKNKANILHLANDQMSSIGFADMGNTGCGDGKICILPDDNLGLGI